MTLLLRPATPADADAIAAHRYPDGEDAAARPAYAAWVREALVSGDYLGLLAEMDFEVVAGAGLVLAGLVYPLLYGIGWFYVRLAEQGERDFVGVVDAEP